MIKLNKVRLRTVCRKAKGKHIFKHRKPYVQLTKMAGEIAELYIDFSERWHQTCTGSGSNGKGEQYQSIAFDNQDESNPNAPYDFFEIELYFNKPVNICGHNDKRCWYGYVQSQKAYERRHKIANFQSIELGKRKA